jgi:glutathione S-transferase
VIASKLDFVEQQIGNGPYLMGQQFTLGDAYLFVILGWTNKMQIDLGGWPNLAAFRERMMERESVREVLQFEGLVPAEAAG